MNNYIYEYYQAVEDGSIVVGKWIKLVVEYVINGLERKEFFYDAKKANRAIRFMENFCHHSEGPLAPQLIKLELWQKFIVSCIFGIVDKNGLRQFREVVLIVSRKNGKSLFASLLAAYEWYIDGGYGARIFCVAPKLEQADIIYSDIWQTVSMEPELMSLAKKRKSDYYIESTNSSVKKIAFNAKKSDGFNPSLTICDEIGTGWRGDAGIKQYEVMKSGMGARPEGLLFSCSTAGYESDGIYDELLKRSTRLLLGDSGEHRLLPFLYMIDDTSKWNDLNELVKSNPNLNVSVSPSYLLEEIAVAEGSLPKRAEFLTKYCCIKMNSSQAWLDAPTIERAYGKPLYLEDFRNSYCVAGLDLSQTTDLTAAVIIIERDSQLYVFCHFWLPANKIDEATERDGIPYRTYIQRGLLSESGENFIDYHDCYNWFTNLIEAYEIYPLQVGYDRYSAQYLVNDLDKYGFHTDSVYQGNNLWPVIQETEGLLKDGTIHIGDNDLLKIHLLNTATRLDSEHGRGRIVKINPNMHIDGVAALLDAMTVRQKWDDSIGEQLKNRS